MTEEEIPQTGWQFDTADRAHLKLQWRGNTRRQHCLGEGPRRTPVAGTETAATVLAGNHQALPQALPSVPAVDKGEEHGQIAARTYRLWKCPDQVVATRTLTDAVVMNLVGDLAWTVDVEGELAGVRRMTPEGLYGRRKMTRLVQRSLPDATPRNT